VFQCFVEENKTFAVYNEYPAWEADLSATDQPD
jgi:hypothetical protein